MDGITFLQAMMASEPIPVVICSGLAEQGSDAGCGRSRPAPWTSSPSPRLRLRAPGGQRPAATSCARRPRPQRRPPARPRSTTLSGSTAAAAARRAARAGAAAHRRDRRWPGHRANRHRHRRLHRRHRGAAGVLRAMPRDAPGIVIVQHMPEKFTKAFAERLDGLCEMEVKEAADGDASLRGRALHRARQPPSALRRSGCALVVEVNDGPPCRRHRPRSTCCSARSPKRRRQRASASS